MQEGGHQGSEGRPLEPDAHRDPVQRGRAGKPRYVEQHLSRGVGDGFARARLLAQRQCPEPFRLRARKLAIVGAHF